MQNPSIPITVLVVGMLAVGVLLIALVVRAGVVARHSGSFSCTLQRRALRGTVWQHGMMRFGTDRLRWFHGLSLRLAPSVLIFRRDILALNREPLPTHGEDDSCLVEFCLRDGTIMRAVVDGPSGAALNAWLEAAPTGLVIGDAD